MIACADSNAAAPIKSFETAVEMLNNAKSAAEIYALLIKVPRFKSFLPKNAPKTVFAMPAPPRQQPSLLQKIQKTKNGDIGAMFKKSCSYTYLKKLEPELSSAGCLEKHGSVMVAVEGVSMSSCSMSGGFHSVGEGGFRCTVCPFTQYCMGCRWLDADAKIADNDGGSVMYDDGTASVSPSTMNSALEQEDEMIGLNVEPNTEMRQEIAQRHQHKYGSNGSDIDSVKRLFANGLDKKRDSKAGEKEQQRQDQLERQAGMSEASRGSNGSKHGVHKRVKC